MVCVSLRICWDSTPHHSAPPFWKNNLKDSFFRQDKAGIPAASPTPAAKAPVALGLPSEPWPNP